LSIQVTGRVATKADHALFERFTCTSDDGPDYEQFVQRYIRAEEIRHVSTLDSLRSNHRLLAVFDGDQMVAIGCHRRGALQNERRFVCAAVRQDHQGRTFSNGERASDVLWAVIGNDIFDRHDDNIVVVSARVHPGNERSLGFCRRIGLTPTELDSSGLLICSGALEGS